jgi:hypothetical protein
VVPILPHTANHFTLRAGKFCFVDNEFFVSVANTGIILFIIISWAFLFHCAALHRSAPSRAFYQASAPLPTTHLPGLVWS